MNRSYCFPVLAALLAVCAAPAWGSTSVGINFVGKYGTAMDPAETAGAVPQTHWNNATGDSGTLPSLADAAGTSTGLAVTWSAKVAYTGIADAAGNNRLMRGYLTQLGTSGPTVGVSGLAAAFPDGYHVLVYFDGDNGAAAWITDYTIGSHTLTGTDLAGTNFSGTFVRDTGSGGNYVEFDGLSGDSFSLTATARSGSTPAINAIQITHAPEPATLCLLAAGLAAALLRRRK
jgi:hypothetical protein